jgi:hypothetical protein
MLNLASEIHERGPPFKQFAGSAANPPVCGPVETEQNTRRRGLIACPAIKTVDLILVPIQEVFIFVLPRPAELNETLPDLIHELVDLRFLALHQDVPPAVDDFQGVCYCFCHRSLRTAAATRDILPRRPVRSYA